MRSPARGHRGRAGAGRSPRPSDRPRRTEVRAALRSAPVLVASAARWRGSSQVAVPVHPSRGQPPARWRIPPQSELRPTFLRRALTTCEERCVVCGLDARPELNSALSAARCRDDGAVAAA